MWACAVVRWGPSVLLCVPPVSDVHRLVVGFKSLPGQRQDLYGWLWGWWAYTCRILRIRVHGREAGKQEGCAWMSMELWRSRGAASFLRGWCQASAAHETVECSPKNMGTLSRNLLPNSSTAEFSPELWMLTRSPAKPLQAAVASLCVCMSSLMKYM